MAIMQGMTNFANMLPTDEKLMPVRSDTKKIINIIITVITMHAVI